MNRFRIITLVGTCFFAVVYSWAADTSSNMFKFHMHQIYDSYNSARISYSLRKFDITGIHLKYLNESIDAAKMYIPDVNRDGSKLDKELFSERLQKLQNDVSSLKFTNDVKYRDPLLVEYLFKDISGMCTTCHKEVNNDPFFKAPKRTTLFGEYMHQVAGNLDLALAMSEDEKLSGKAEEHVKLVNFYLGLLEPIFPESGLSGDMMDKKLFQKKLAGINSSLQKEGGALTPGDLKQSIKLISDLCVGCHGPATR